MVLLSMGKQKAGLSNHGDDAVERLADYIHRVTQLESEGKVSRVTTNPDPVEQDKGGNCSGQCDTGGDRQDSCPYRQSVRQAERQD